MKPILIVDDDDALGFGLAGMFDQKSPDEDAVYIVSASKAALVPPGAPVVILPSPPRTGEKVPKADEGDVHGPEHGPSPALRQAQGTLSPQAG